MKHQALAGFSAFLLLAAASSAMAADDADAFGALESARSMELSADGKQLVFTGPGKGKGTRAVVVDLATFKSAQVISSDGNPFNLSSCDWSAPERVVCSLRAITQAGAMLIPMQRMLSLNINGGKVLPMGVPTPPGTRQYDGSVVDWMSGLDGNVLMERRYPGGGSGVDLMDTRTGKAKIIEMARSDNAGFISDGLGRIRIRATQDKDTGGQLRGTTRFYYRRADMGNWQELGTYRVDSKGKAEPGSISPLAVDPKLDAAYVLKPLRGRQAMYRVALDGSMREELVFASPEVDIDGVVRIGRGGRVIGATYATDRRRVEYFDPAYKELERQLIQALPKLPLIRFISASADEKILLVWGGSDVEPGQYFTIDRSRNVVEQVHLSRPELEGRKLSAVKSISYPASDGTPIPAYLTLPPGVTDAKGLPALVLPHGGPQARDEWGFDWLSQFFAHRGFAVLQPNFRGSAGYGSQWFAENGFRGWKTSIGDVRDAARWLVAQGIADPAKLAVFGWSYGGYAALQANVLDANLFKAVVAVAPVTDLALLRHQGNGFTNANLQDQFIGAGAHIEEGSPANNAKAFVAPVLMFHGDTDFNVSIDQSRRMDRELRGAGKSSELVVYPGLDHSLVDGTARADMLRRTEAFLRRHLGL
jgi:dipeptidyl aminopeptidase/acylaminoacyl peptidase